MKTKGIDGIRKIQLARIVSKIRQAGPISFTQARQAMQGNPRDARFHNMTIQEFIAAGKLTISWDNTGNSLIGI